LAKKKGRAPAFGGQTNKNHKGEGKISPSPFAPSSRNMSGFLWRAPWLFYTGVTFSVDPDGKAEPHPFSPRLGFHSERVMLYSRSDKKRPGTAPSGCESSRKASQLVTENKVLTNQSTRFYP
jgi:hypothetical protein